MKTTQQRATLRLLTGLFFSLLTVSGSSQLVRHFQMGLNVIEESSGFSSQEAFKNASFKVKDNVLTLKGDKDFEFTVVNMSAPLDGKDLVTVDGGMMVFQYRVLSPNTSLEMECKLKGKGIERTMKVILENMNDLSFCTINMIEGARTIDFLKGEKRMFYELDQSIYPKLQSGFSDISCLANDSCTPTMLLTEHGQRVARTRKEKAGVEMVQMLEWRADSVMRAVFPDQIVSNNFTMICAQNTGGCAQSGKCDLTANEKCDEARLTYSFLDPATRVKFDVFVAVSTQGAGVEEPVLPKAFTTDDFDFMSENEVKTHLATAVESPKTTGENGADLACTFTVGISKLDQRETPQPGFYYELMDTHTTRWLVDARSGEIVSKVVPVLDRLPTKAK